MSIHHQRHQLPYCCYFWWWCEDSKKKISSALLGPINNNATTSDAAMEWNRRSRLKTLYLSLPENLSLNSDRKYRLVPEPYLVPYVYRMVPEPRYKVQVPVQNFGTEPREVQVLGLGRNRSEPYRVHP
ncbi:hypothetical protein C5167_017781 [Papaver somniferum]|uniref:Uncharacterized protein n=1 Tax=Papaver somniferum TaxID=3469 RepID=A0A4Y7INR4_PAPSO|nr:hypothetical protein C5167_017781 [Papaver somniferum]